MNEPRVESLSVVVATFNRLESLLTLLGDLGAQEALGASFDVVVVDDGSAHAVAPELDGRTLHFPLKVVTQANGGPAKARHAGIAVATGEWIVIVDDDMMLPPSFLREHLAAHRTGDGAGVDVVMGHIRGPRDRSSLSLFERFHQYSLDRFVTAHRRGELVLDGGRLCTGNVSFRKRDYLAVGGFDLSLGRLEDRELGIRFEEAGYTIAFSELAWNEHRSDHEDAATWRRRSRLYGELDTVIAAKYPAKSSVSPWSFLPHIPKVTWPAALVCALVPPLGQLGAKVIYGIGDRLDRRGQSGAALQCAAVVYALDYFSGAGQRLGGPGAVFASIRAWRRNAKLEAVRP